MKDHISFDSAFGTRFSVSVDTEEEFDWAGKLSRYDHGARSTYALAKGQSYFKANGVVPIYYVDQPIVDDATAVHILGTAAADGEANIGIHLHPWVTPPFVERVNRHNSYVGNLAPEIERAKIETMRNQIIERLGVTPISYRAGRYGIGPNSYEILAQAGIVMDSSVRPLFDYSNDGGPDFSRSSQQPYWTDKTRQMIEVPLTAHFLGWGGPLMPALFRAVRGSATLRAIAARTGVVSRIPLTPEGTPPALACAMIDIGLAHGVRLFSMSFHSPSLAAGFTPYVKDDADLAAFYHWFDVVFAHFARRGVAHASLDEIVQAARDVGAA